MWFMSLFGLIFLSFFTNQRGKRNIKNTKKKKKKESNQKQQLMFYGYFPCNYQPLVLCPLFLQFPTSCLCPFLFEILKKLNFIYFQSINVITKYVTYFCFFFLLAHPVFNIYIPLIFILDFPFWPTR